MPNHSRFIWLMASIAWLLFILIAYLASTKITLPVDIAVLRHIHHLHSAGLDKASVTLTTIADPYTILVISGMISIAYWKNHRATAIFVALAVSGSLASGLLLKLLLHRPRPDSWTHLVIETDFSFPSGHATITMALALVLIFLVWHTKWRWLVIVLGAIVVGAIGLSRLYVGVHYPSDIVAGWLLSIGWVSLIWLFIKCKTSLSNELTTKTNAT